MSVVQKYASVSEQYGSLEILAQQDPALASDIVRELSQSQDPQDQAALQALSDSGFVPSYSSGFVIHQDMKDAMTRQQEAYAAPAVSQPTGNPVYNAVVAAAAKEPEPKLDIAMAPVETVVQPIDVAPKSDFISEAIGFLNLLVTQPTVAIKTILEPIAEVQAKDTGLVADVAGLYIGSAGLYLNTYETATSKISSIIGSSSQLQIVSPMQPNLGKLTQLPTTDEPLNLFTPKSEMQQLGYNITEVGAVVTVSAALPVVGSAIGIGATSVIAGELINLGVSQGVKAVSGEGWLTPLEAAQSAAIGGAFSLVAGGIYKGIGTVAPKVVESAIGRIGIGAGIGGGAGYVLSEGDLAETAKGAALGAGLAFGVESVRLLNVRVIQPRAEVGLSKSYAKTLETSELWKPSLREQAVMKLTGAKPQAPFLKAQATELLSESYLRQAKLNEAILFDKPLPSGSTQKAGVWTPTIKEAEIMRIVNVAPKVPASAVNTVKLMSGASMDEYFGTYKTPMPANTMKSLMVADDLWEFSFAPKTSLQIVTATPKLASSVTPATVKPVLPIIFNPKTFREAKLDEDVKASLKIAEENELLKQMAIDKSYGKLPESQLSYDYRGSFSFKKVSPVSKSSSSQATEVVSTKNLNLIKATPTETLRYVDTFMRASKPVTQVKFGASWGEQEVITVAKPVLPSASVLTRQVAAAPKATVASIPKMAPVPVVLPVQTTQVQNPFLQFKGATYYKQATVAKDDYEEIVISYPKSGLPTPISVTRITQIQDVLPSQTQRERQALQMPQMPKQSQLTTPIEIPSPTQIPSIIQVPSPTQIDKELEKTVQQPQLKTVFKSSVIQMPKQPQPETPKPPVITIPKTSVFPRGLPAGLKADLRGFGKPSRRLKSISKRQERVYPVLPAKKALEKALKGL